METVLWRRSLEGMLLLLPLDRARPIEMTGSAAALWESLATPVSMAEAAGMLGDAHGTSADAILADVQPLLEEMSRLGVVMEVP